MSKHKRGEQLFIGGIGTGDYWCSNHPDCEQFFPCDSFKKSEILSQLREEVGGLRTWKIDSKGVFVDEPNKGQLLSRTDVLALLDKLEQGDK